MAKIARITVGMARKYQGPVQFESFQIEGSVTVELEGDETPEDARRKAFPVLREQMRETYREFKPKPPKPKGG